MNSPLNYQGKKKAKCDFAFFFIFNHLSVIENGGTSLCRGNPEVIRVSLCNNPDCFSFVIGFAIFLTGPSKLD